MPPISDEELAAAIEYLEEHPEIDDLLISGGDPLLLSNEAINRILSAVTKVKSIKAIRIATRVLVTLPMRITPGLINIFSKYKPIFVNTQFNHPRELTPEALSAASMLIDAGIPVANQFVLLKGVNDTPECVEELCRTLYHNRIRPYYMFQCDLVRGVEHFRTPLSTGINIMDYLRGRLSGMAIPNFCVDIPGLSGKIELLPNYIIEEKPNETILRDNRGRVTSYPSPITTK
jgi:lysine 2,3-aminomutase